jgi:RecB family exonuclease
MRLQLRVAPLVPDLDAALLDDLPADGLEQPIHVVVPTPALGRALQRAHAERHGTSVGLHTLGWNDLAARLTACERGGRHRLGPEARAWMVHALHEGRRRRGPTCFDAVLAARGFRAALERTFDALGRAGVATASDAERLLVAHGFDLPLQARHVLELYLAYRQAFEATHDDTAALLARAARIPDGRTAAVLGTPRLWVHGFEGLEPPELALLARIARDLEVELRVFIARADPEEPGLEAALRDLGFATRVTPAPPCRGPAEVRVLAAPSEESAAEEICRAVLTAAEAGIAFRDMGVVVRYPHRLALLHAALARRGVPCLVHAGPPLLAGRIGRALLAFFEVAEQGLALEPVLDFFAVAPLAPSWAGLAAEAVPSAWERVAREAVPGGRLERWQERLAALAAEQRALAERLERDAEPTQRALHTARAADELRCAVTALHETLQRLPQRGRWNEHVQAVDAFLASALRAGPDVEAVRAALARLGALDSLGTAAVSRAQFRDALRGVLAAPTADDVAIAAGDGVHLGTAASLRGIAFDMVCLAGAQASEWPGPVAEDPVLGAAGRTALGAILGAEALPVPEEEARRARRLFWSVCAAARRRLVVAYARLDPATGAGLLPSALLLELAERRLGRRIDYETFAALPWVEHVPLQRIGVPDDLTVLDLHEFDTLATLALPPAAARRYAGRLGGWTRAGLLLDGWRNRRARFTAVDGILAGHASRAALAHRFRARSFSATQLATYAACPFRYYLRNVLRLEPLDRDPRGEPSGLEIGRLVHDILERFHRRLAGEGLRLAALPPAELAARLHAACDAAGAASAARGSSGPRLLWEVRTQRLREDLLRFLRQEAARSGRGWIPQAFETRFGGGPQAPAVVRPDGARIRLHGVIDRLDRDAAGRLRVVDYKSGRPLRPGTPEAVQLAVYLWAATHGDASRLARAEACYLYVTRRGGFGAQKLDGPVLEARRTDFQRFVAAVTSGIESGQFFPQPGPHAARCQSCDYLGVCDARVAQQAEHKMRAGQHRALSELTDFASLLEDVPAAAAADGEAG